MAIEMAFGCEHTEALEIELVDVINGFRDQYPNHDQQFLAVVARVVGSLMATHMFSGIPDMLIESIVKENMRFAITEQIKRQLEATDGPATVIHPGSDTKQ